MLHYVSTSGWGVALAHHAQAMGVKATLHCPELPCGRGLVRKVATPTPPSKTRAVIMDGLGNGDLAERLAVEGKRVLFGGKFAELMAVSDYHTQFCAKAGLEIEADTDGAVSPYLLAVGAWHEEGLGAPYFAAVLNQHLWTGDLGPTAGITGVSLKAVAEDYPAIETYVRPAEEALSSVGYRGTVVALLSRQGNDLRFKGLAVGLQPMITSALSEILYGGIESLLIEGSASPSRDYALSVLTTLYPWPTAVPANEDYRYQLAPDQGKHFWPMDAVADKGQIRYAGQLGILGISSARGRPYGDTSESGTEPMGLEQARGRAYRTVRNLFAPPVQYRTDIGEDGAGILRWLDHWAK